MKRSEYIKLGILLIIAALLIGVLPAAATLLRAGSGGADVDTTQQSTDTSGALSFLGLSLPVLLIGIGLIVAGVKKDSEED